MDQASYAFARCHEAFIGIVRYNKVVIIEIIIIVAVAPIVVILIKVIGVILVVLVVVGHGRMGVVCVSGMHHVDLCIPLRKHITIACCHGEIAFGVLAARYTHVCCIAKT